MSDQKLDAASEQSISEFFKALAAIHIGGVPNWGHQTQVNEFLSRALAPETSGYLQAELLGYLSGLVVTGAICADEVSDFTQQIRELTDRGLL
jgi:hypothetical protein